MLKKLMTIAMLAALAIPVSAKDKVEKGPTLKVGDAAPKLACGKFVQGEPVKEFEKGKVYVVEFWSTWCGPCRMTIPHLNELWEANKDKGLVVIGQDCWERDDDAVEKFVKKMGAKMTYRVALDDKSGDKDGAMAKTWMAAAGQDGIPAAFVVDKEGKIVWIGHPMDGLDEVVPAVLAGTFDWKKDAEKRAAAEKAADKEEEPEAEVTLHVGDAAPKLACGKFIQGDAVKEFEKDKVYVVEFWSTWCGPCVQSIPHLNEVWKKNKDKGLVVIGQNCWEQKEDGVEKFVKKMGEKMTYRVALDDKSKDEKGAMAKTWMEAAGQHGIPCAFVVDKAGKIAWIGHPMSGLDTVVEAVLAGKFDAKKMEEERVAKEKTEQERYEKFVAAMMGKKWDEALKIVDEIEKAAPEDEAAGYWAARLQIYRMSKNTEAARKIIAEAGQKNNDNESVLNDLAWTIATDKNMDKESDVALAEKLATRANEIAKSENPAILDTLARVMFMKGEKDKAIELQKKAILLAEDELREDMKDTLDSYKKGVLPKIEEEPMPFGVDEQ